MSRKRKHRHRQRRVDFNEFFTTEVTDLNHEGRGVARIDGKVVFLRNALPGETVEFHYTRKHNSHDEGTAIKIIKPSPDRIEPKCQVTARCGGCSLQHLAHDKQIDFKQNTFNELLNQANIIPTEMAPALLGNSFNYRRKARMSARYVAGKGDPLVGFREQNGRYITDMHACPILSEPFGSGIQMLRALLLKLDCKAEVPQIEITVTDNNAAMIIRHMCELTDNDKAHLMSFGEKNNIIIFLQPKGYDSIHQFYPGEKIELSYPLDDFNLVMTLKPDQFMQVNRDINAKMLTQAIRWLELTDQDSVLDLFCGIGNFSLPIAKTAKHVTGVEADDSAVMQASHNAKLNQLTNTDFYSCNLFEKKDIEKSAWISNSYNKLLLDPPRSGAIEIIEYFAKTTFDSIVYVSCNPATFCRDAAILIEQGYKLERAGIMDMFPHTQHLEVMGLFK